jgi:hypothetical protein
MYPKFWSVDSSQIWSPGVMIGPSVEQVAKYPVGRGDVDPPFIA